MKPPSALAAQRAFAVGAVDALHFAAASSAAAAAWPQPWAAWPNPISAIDRV